MGCKWGQYIALNIKLARLKMSYTVKNIRPLLYLQMWFRYTLDHALSNNNRDVLCIFHSPQFYFEFRLPIGNLHAQLIHDFLRKPDKNKNLTIQITSIISFLINNFLYSRTFYFLLPNRYINFIRLITLTKKSKMITFYSQRLAHHI